MKIRNTEGFKFLKSSCRKCYSPEHYAKEKGNHIGLYCLMCDSWITWIKKESGEYEIWFGKFKGKKLNEINTNELTKYYNFLSDLALDKDKKKCLVKICTYLETKNVQFWRK